VKASTALFDQAGVQEHAGLRHVTRAIESSSIFVYGRPILPGVTKENQWTSVVSSGGQTRAGAMRDEAVSRGRKMRRVWSRSEAVAIPGSRFVLRECTLEHLASALDRFV